MLGGCFVGLILVTLVICHFVHAHWAWPTVSIHCCQICLWIAGCLWEDLVCIAFFSRQSSSLAAILNDSDNG